jgi:alanyl-tRNA synthetase
VTAPKTEKLYLNDPYTVTFRAKVLEGNPGEGGRATVVLDRSCFYPDSGGQTPDTGTIGDAAVIDVQEGDGDTVVHFVDTTRGSPAPAAGEEVECKVDWPRRFDHMQQHTGQHVLSRAFIQAGGLHTVSFHLGEEACTIDLEGSGFSEEVAEFAENLANSTIVQNRPVTIRTLPVSRLDLIEDLELRRALPEGVTEARLVEVEDFDVIPCCGTHVRSTGELGHIKIIRTEKAKGLQRVHFKVGERATRDYRVKHDLVQMLGNKLTTSAADIADKVDKLSAENQRSRREIKRLSQALAEFETASLLAGQGADSGPRVIVHYYADRGDEFLRMVSTALKKEPDTVAVLGAGTGCVVCSASDGVSIDFGPLAVEPAKALGGSGGGKGPFAQLKLPADSDVGQFVEDIANNVKRSI